MHSSYSLLLFALSGLLFIVVIPAEEEEEDHGSGWFYKGKVAFHIRSSTSTPQVDLPHTSKHVEELLR